MPLNLEMTAGSGQGPQQQEERNEAITAQGGVRAPAGPETQGGSWSAGSQFAPEPGCPRSNPLGSSVPPSSGVPPTHGQVSLGGEGREMHQSSGRVNPDAWVG